MVAVISVLFVLAIAFSLYKQAKSNGQWSWPGFFVILGSMCLLIAGVIIPIVNSKTLRAHPALMMTLLLGGILVFVVALLIACRKYYARFFVK